MAQSLDGDGLTAQLFSALATVNDVIVGTGVFAVSFNLILHNNLTIGVVIHILAIVIIPGHNLSLFIPNSRTITGITIKNEILPLDTCAQRRLGEIESIGADAVGATGSLDRFYAEIRTIKNLDIFPTGAAVEKHFNFPLSTIIVTAQIGPVEEVNTGMRSTCRHISTAVLTLTSLAGRFGIGDVRSIGTHGFTTRTLHSMGGVVMVVDILIGSADMLSFPDHIDRSGGSEDSALLYRVFAVPIIGKTGKDIAVLGVYFLAGLVIPADRISLGVPGIGRLARILAVRTAIIIHGKQPGAADTGIALVRLNAKLFTAGADAVVSVCVDGVMIVSVDMILLEYNDHIQIFRAVDIGELHIGAVGILQSVQTITLGNIFIQTICLYKIFQSVIGFSIDEANRVQEVLIINGIPIEVNNRFGQSTTFAHAISVGMFLILADALAAGALHGVGAVVVVDVAVGDTGVLVAAAGIAQLVFIGAVGAGRGSAVNAVAALVGGNLSVGIVTIVPVGHGGSTDVIFLILFAGDSHGLFISPVFREGGSEDSGFLSLAGAGSDIGGYFFRPCGFFVLADFDLAGARSRTIRIISAPIVRNSTPRMTSRNGFDGLSSEFFFTFGAKGDGFHLALLGARGRGGLFSGSLRALMVAARSGFTGHRNLAGEYTLHTAIFSILEGF